MYVLEADYVGDVNGLNTIAVASTTTVYTRGHKVHLASIFGLGISIASTLGTPNVLVEMQVSDSAPAALSGVVDTVGLDWCVQEGGSAILTVTDKVLHKITLSPTPSKYIRFKLTGQGSNPADAVATLRLANQQQF